MARLHSNIQVQTATWSFSEFGGAVGTYGFGIIFPKFITNIFFLIRCTEDFIAVPGTTFSMGIRDTNGFSFPQPFYYFPATAINTLVVGFMNIGGGLPVVTDQSEVEATFSLNNNPITAGAIIVEAIYIRTTENG